MQKEINHVWELLNLFETAVDCQIREPAGKLNWLFDGADVETAISEDATGSLELVIIAGDNCYVVTIKEESSFEHINRLLREKKHVKLE